MYHFIRVSVSELGGKRSGVNGMQRVSGNHPTPHAGHGIPAHTPPTTPTTPTTQATQATLNHHAGSAAGDVFGLRIYCVVLQRVHVAVQVKVHVRPIQQRLKRKLSRRELELVCAVVTDHNGPLGRPRRLRRLRTNFIQDPGQPRHLWLTRLCQNIFMEPTLAGLWRARGKLLSARVPLHGVVLAVVVHAGAGVKRNQVNNRASAST